MKHLLLTSTILALGALPLSAQEVAKSGYFANTVKNIGNALNIGQGEEAVKSAVSAIAVDVANVGLDKVEDKVLSTSNFTHFELSVGSDTMGLDENKSNVKTEAMTVYRLKETGHWFFFNQTSAVNYNSRTTINTGFGARHINDADTVIIGYNVFYDYELQSKHERVGAGLELLSSIFEFRANTYQAVSKTLTYNSIQETALDGYDAKLTANLPYFYSSNLYGKITNWKDDASYDTEHYEAGINAEIAPNLTLRVAAQHVRNSGNTKGVASLNYSVPLGGANQPAKVKQDGVWTTKYEPIREKLYRPVQRENRIMKKAIKLGVTVSGY